MKNETKEKVRTLRPETVPSLWLSLVSEEEKKEWLCTLAESIKPAAAAYFAWLRENSGKMLKVSDDLQIEAPAAPESQTYGIALSTTSLAIWLSACRLAAIRAEKPAKPATKSERRAEVLARLQDAIAKGDLNAAAACAAELNEI